ncbi:hypothetical protein WMY93_020260 [Mugilogobius chulae]|uniref:Jacalin-type lectin domain-containing protein n=1 Tax=Mugilogobius chulae TaxID=88201 RepID=A0AAW0NLH5_9GOBI
MHSFILCALLASSALLAFATEEQHYSFSPLAGSNSGTPFSLTGEERITGVRVWDNGGYIYGLQFRYGAIWSSIIGNSYGRVEEILLYDDEAIIQVSGKYSHYIHAVVFVTNRGRSLFAGQFSGISFNMYPEFEGAELRFISGTLHGSLTGLSAHWAVVSQDSNEH